MTVDDTIAFIVDHDEALREAPGEPLEANGVRSALSRSAGDYIDSDEPDLPASNCSG